MSLPTSYSTASVYKTVPQFIQDKDAENGYPLWYYIYSVAQTIDSINVLTRDYMGPGIHVEADFGNYTGSGISDAQLAYAISATDKTITIFNTDKTWQVIDTSVSFKLKIVDTAINVEEIITVPAGNYNWLAPFVILTNVTRGANAVEHDASTGADGSIYIKDYLGAYGWSQAIDIVRCPNYALPWLAQFVGAEILPNSNLNRQQMTQKIEQRAGFDRATANAIVDELVAITNSQIPTSIAPLSRSQVIILENAQAVNSGSTTSYIYNQYALTLLIPTRVFSNYTYQSLKDAAGGNAATYTTTDTFISSLGGLYFSLSGNTQPNNNSPYVNFVYRYRPAGMQIFVGGY